MARIALDRCEGASLLLDVDRDNFPLTLHQEFEFSVVLTFPVIEVNATEREFVGYVVLKEDAHIHVDGILEIGHIDPALIGEKPGVDAIDAVITPLVFP